MQLDRVKYTQQTLEMNKNTMNYKKQKDQIQGIINSKSNTEMEMYIKERCKMI